jgi:hypothetical protein
MNVVMQKLQNVTLSNSYVPIVGREGDSGGPKRQYCDECKGERPVKVHEGCKCQSGLYSRQTSVLVLLEVGAVTATGGTD